MKTSLIFAAIVLATTADGCAMDTVGEALVAGQWRTPDALLTMSHQDERNTLITELSHITSESVDWLQSNDDDALIEYAAVAIFLRDEEIRQEDKLAEMSKEDQRNTLITVLHNWTDDPVDDLQSKSSMDLVVIGCAFAGQLYLAAEVVVFDWDVDSGQLVEEAPTLLSEQLNNNCNSSVPFTAKFSYSKKITEQTTFTHNGEFRMDFTAEANFEAEVPFLLKAGGSASIKLGGTKSWGDEELDAITETYSDSITIEVPPGEAILVEALVIIATIDVPYTMTVRTALNTTEVITGVWKGVSMAELQKTQIDIPCEAL